MNIIDYLKGKAILAPMAGVADRAFRELCVEHTAAFVVTDMVSAKGLTMHDRKSKELISLSEKERPAAIQLFGSDPQIMAHAVYLLLDNKPEIIDLNMGCPAPKIVSNGCGSALMKNPELIGEIVKAVVRETNIPVTVKIRAGWDDESVNAVEVAKRIEQAGAYAITIHGRTRQQMYAPSVNLDIIKEVKEAVAIPVIGNGDIVDGKSAKNMLDFTNCDAIMIGRGALGNPWVFEQVNAYLKDGTILPPPTIETRMETMLYHIEKLCLYKGKKIGMMEARKHAAWYIKGIRGAAAFRQEIGMLSDIDELKTMAEKVIEAYYQNII